VKAVAAICRAAPRVRIVAMSGEHDSVRLHVSERTVKRLTAALLHKLRVTTRIEAAVLAGGAGLV
jgi:CII-binding regulator of phage lambda lysogenization HflD